MTTAAEANAARTPEPLGEMPGPCPCWRFGAHKHIAEHCCQTPGATCHETEGQAILRGEFL